MRSKLHKTVAIVTAMGMIAVSPMAALAAASDGEDIQGVVTKTVDGDIENTTGKTGISMSDMPEGGNKLDADITVKGDVSISNKDFSQAIPQGVRIESDGGKATVNVEGGISVDSSKDDEGKGGYYAQGISTKGATSNITVGGDVDVTSDEIALGVASGYNKSEVSFGGDNTIKIGGDLDVSSEGSYAEGIIIYDKTNMTVDGDVTVASDDSAAIGAELGSLRSEGELKIGGSVDVSGDSARGIWVTTDGVESAKGNGIKVTVSGDVEASGDDWAAGVLVTENDKDVNITVEGDIKSTTYGIYVNENSGNAKIVSGGTISSEKGAAIVVVKPTDDEKAPEVTAWKIVSGTENLVDSDDDEYAKEFQSAINYIIKADTTEPE